MEANEVAKKAFSGEKLNKKGQKIFFWKGKIVTEKVYRNRLRLVETGKNIRKNWMEKCETKADSIANSAKDEKKFIKIEGCRIVDVEFLGKQMNCQNCQEILSFNRCVEEKIFGLASIFYIECQQCKVVSPVCTDKQHTTADKETHFDINTAIRKGK